MTMNNVIFERTGAVARLSFNRPSKLNALSPDLIAEALEVSEAVAKSDARVLVVAGEGRAFSAGVDLQSLTASNVDPAATKRFSEQARALERCWESAPQVVIARVNGYCFTGGLELALACDFIVAADDATFADTHALLGSYSHWGMSQRLPRRIGVQRAKEMSLTARRVGAEEAVRIGLILEAVPLEHLDARIAASVEAIVSTSIDSVAAYKDLFLQSQNRFLNDALAFEASSTYPLPDRAARRKEAYDKLGNA